MPAGLACLVMGEREESDMTGVEFKELIEKKFLPNFGVEDLDPSEREIIVSALNFNYEPPKTFFDPRLPPVSPSENREWREKEKKKAFVEVGLFVLVS